MTPDELDAIRARAEAARQAAASGTTGTPPNVDGLSIHDALDIFAESAEDVPALLDEVGRLRCGRNIWRAMRDRAREDLAALLADRDRLAAIVERVRELHQPHLVIGPHQKCDGCESRWPCPTITAIEGTDS